MSAAPNPEVLIIGLDAGSKTFVQPLLSSAQLRELGPSDIDKLIDAPPETTPTLILCGPDLGALTAVELAQFLRTLFQETPLYYLMEPVPNFDREALIKNGFEDTFTLAFDREKLPAAIKEALSKAGTIKAYRPVKIIDLESDKPLDFDVSIYLTANNKYIKTTNAGDALSTQQIERLRKHSVRSLYVPKEQMPKFYEYTANRLKNITTDDKLSATEKQERFEGSVRTLLLGVLGNTQAEGTIGEGRALVADCKKIISSYVSKTPSNDLFQQITAVACDANDPYAHASNVSAYAALFAMGTGLAKPEDLAIAGLLHDIGDTEQKRDPEHVKRSLTLIKQRKLILTDNVYKAISQHHEWFNGAGFPEKVKGERISIEARILAIADYFDELTVARPGERRLTPREALNELRKFVDVNPSEQRFDPQVLKKILALFSE